MNDTSDTPPNSLGPGLAKSSSRRPYEPPTLRRYGAIRTLTSGGAGSQPEAGSMSPTQFP